MDAFVDGSHHSDAALHSILQDIYGPNYLKESRAKIILSDFHAQLLPSSSPSMFCSWVKKTVHLITPIMDCREILRERIIGEHFWIRLSEQRLSSKALSCFTFVLSISRDAIEIQRKRECKLLLGNIKISKEGKTVRGSPRHSNKRSVKMSEFNYRMTESAHNKAFPSRSSTFDDIESLCDIIQEPGSLPSKNVNHSNHDDDEESLDLFSEEADATGSIMGIQSQECWV